MTDKEIRDELNRMVQRGELRIVGLRDDGEPVYAKGDKPIAPRRIPCRCGVDVRDCWRGCTLYVCCGGYVREGHMSDCPGAKPETIHGVRERRWYTGE